MIHMTTNDLIYGQLLLFITFLFAEGPIIKGIISLIRETFFPPKPW